MGVGLHHAGILPSLKRLTEVLFERGLVPGGLRHRDDVRSGIHMPARSVVLQGLTKRTDRGFRALTHNELTQMAGRAGRRGIDPEGQCVIALDARDGLEETLSVVDGLAGADREPVPAWASARSRSWSRTCGTRRRSGAWSSPRSASTRTSARSATWSARWRRRRRRWPRPSDTQAPCGEFDRIGRYRQLRAEVDARRRAAGARSRPARARALDDVEPGRVVLLRQRGSGAGLGVVVGVHRLRGHRVLLDTLLPARLARAREGGERQAGLLGDAAAAPAARGAEPRRAASRVGARRPGGAGPRRRRAPDAARPARCPRPRRAGERRGDPAEALARIECHACPWESRPRCEAAWKAVEKERARLEHRRAALESIRDAIWQEYRRVLEVLEPSTPSSAACSGRRASWSPRSGTTTSS